MANIVASLVVVLVCSLPMRALAEDSSECPDEDLVTAYPLPADIDKYEVSHDLVQKSVPGEQRCLVFGKLWKTQKDLTFVAFAHSMVYKDQRPDHEQIRIGIYRSEGGLPYQLVAKTAAPMPAPPSWSDRWGNDAALVSLDFAPYKLTPTEYAFGVRWKQTFVYPSDGPADTRSGHNETLTVYRVVGDKVVPILSTWMRSDIESGHTSSADIVVLETRTKGVFDWKKRGAGSVLLKWTGSRFELAGPDIVKDQNP